MSILHGNVQAVEFGDGILSSHTSSILKQKDSGGIVSTPAGEVQWSKLETRDCEGIRGVGWSAGCVRAMSERV